MAGKLRLTFSHSGLTPLCKISQYSQWKYFRKLQKKKKEGDQCVSRNKVVRVLQQNKTSGYFISSFTWLKKRGGKISQSVATCAGLGATHSGVPMPATSAHDAYETNEQRLSNGLNRSWRDSRSVAASQFRFPFFYINTISFQQKLRTIIILM